MCDICNDTRVVHEDDQSTITFQTCPVCGPYTEEEREARYKKIRARLEELEIFLGMKSA
ncbi:hypothetical protein [uncultured Metabacillus sp.]|uniref:hypothetical protein n=1 Tax=uncultured Metabacillus sp. TaxID=2860135 RepID=UPI00262CBFC0|nr:hypothetical protein [uncultured Metabacillus sp.]